MMNKKKEKNNIGNSLHMFDKNILIIIAMIVIVGFVITINVIQAYKNQTNIVNQNDRIIKDIDANTIFLKDAMKDIGNATLQKNVAELIKQNTVEISDLKQILNDTNEKLENLSTSNNKTR